MFQWKIQNLNIFRLKSPANYQDVSSPLLKSYDLWYANFPIGRVSVSTWICMRFEQFYRFIHVKDHICARVHCVHHRICSKWFYTNTRFYRNDSLKSIELMLYKPKCIRKVQKLSPHAHIAFRSKSWFNAAQYANEIMQSQSEMLMLHVLMFFFKRCICVIFYVLVNVIQWKLARRKFLEFVQEFFF